MVPYVYICFISLQSEILAQTAENKYEMTAATELKKRLADVQMFINAPRTQRPKRLCRSKDSKLIGKLKKYVYK